MIHFYHVTKRFDRYSMALNDVTFHIEKGEFVFLTGWRTKNPPRCRPSATK